MSPANIFKVSSCKLSGLHDMCTIRDLVGASIRCLQSLLSRNDPTKPFLMYN